MRGRSKGVLDALSVDDMFVAKPPFSLSLTIPFENECTGTHRVGLYYFRDNSLRYVCDVTDVENSIILKNYFPWAIGAPLVIGIRDQARAAINQTLDIFSVQPSDLTGISGGER